MTASVEQLGELQSEGAAPAAREVSAPIRPYPAIYARKDLAVAPRIEAIAAVRGEIACTNEDLICNSGCNWSPMSADEASATTGIERRRYCADSLDELSLRGESPGDGG